MVYALVWIALLLSLVHSVRYNEISKEKLRDTHGIIYILIMTSILLKVIKTTTYSHMVILDTTDVTMTTHGSWNNVAVPSTASMFERFTKKLPLQYFRAPNLSR